METLQENKPHPNFMFDPEQPTLKGNQKPNFGEKEGFKYAKQLEELKQFLGDCDEGKAKEFLEMTYGNVEQAMQLMFP